MSRILSLALAGTTAIGLSAGSFTAAEAAPLPALNAVQVGGGNASVENVRWRGGYGHGYYGRGYYGRGYGYRRGPGIGGALAAGAALGIIGGAIAASQAPRYGYYDNGYVGAGYGYGARAYDYGYAAPAYGYGYAAPAYGYSYGYPAYGYGY
ncbi:hypothetical protein [Methylobacterium gossipiicola]|uniref:Uncharacterized protein n=1 Tax=Methylobacterium gossipiicola TaxID=582675 RepID=A0A1I2R6T1_9HYPH|nr:hypothetical protein [Methylobacterium gossipiicola]SFG36434.1 hypothetical protein SAMN05192565_102127 [Methylobacterium gossipiicola]